MNQLFVKKIGTDKKVSLSEAEHLLEKHSVTHQIKTINWKEYSYLPKVNFRIAHNGSEIWLKYYIQEHNIRAMETKINGDVYKDSCVEFFLSLDGKNYYNFEFNCIGTKHLAYGPEKNNRKLVDPAIVEKIETKSSLGNQPFDNKSGNFEWEIMVRIPLECLCHSNKKSFNGLKANANFYKCGDETAEMHFVTWNPIKTETPNYHQPDFFGKIQFE